MVPIKTDKKVFHEVILPKTIVKSKGRMYYKESSQAWCFLRLRKEIIDEFNQLREKYSKFSYDAVYYRTYEELEKALRESKKNGEPLPILMWLIKDMKQMKENLPC